MILKVFLVQGFCPLKTEIADFLSAFIWRSQEEWEEQCQLHLVTVRLYVYLCIYFFRFFFCFLVSLVHLVLLYQLLKYIKLLATCVRIYVHEKLFFNNMAFHETTYTKHQEPTEEWCYSIKLQNYIMKLWQSWYLMMAQYWNIFLTANISKFNTWPENAWIDLLQNSCEKRYFIQFAILFLC